MKAGTEAEAMREWCLVACAPWLARLVFVDNPGSFAQGWHLYRKLGSPLLLLIKKVFHRLAYRLMPWRQFSYLRFPLFKWPKLKSSWQIINDQGVDEKSSSPSTSLPTFHELVKPLPQATILSETLSKNPFRFATHAPLLFLLSAERNDPLSFVDPKLCSHLWKLKRATPSVVWEQSVLAGTSLQ